MGIRATKQEGFEFSNEDPDNTVAGLYEQEKGDYDVV
jgi:hypothetical protein